MIPTGFDPRPFRRGKVPNASVMQHGRARPLDTLPVTIIIAVVSTAISAIVQLGTQDRTVGIRTKVVNRALVNRALVNRSLVNRAVAGSLGAVLIIARRCVEKRCIVSRRRAGDVNASVHAQRGFRRRRNHRFQKRPNCS